MRAYVNYLAFLFIKEYPHMFLTGTDRNRPNRSSLQLLLETTPLNGDDPLMLSISNISQTQSRLGQQLEVQPEVRKAGPVEQFVTKATSDRQLEALLEVQDSASNPERSRCVSNDTNKAILIQGVRGTAAVLPCNFSKLGLVPHQTCLVWTDPDGKTIDFSNPTFLITTDSQRMRMIVVCSSLYKGVFECLHFGVRRHPPSDGMRPPDTQATTTRISFILLDEATGQPIPIPGRRRFCNTPEQVSRKAVPSTTAAPPKIAGIVLTTPLNPKAPSKKG